MKSEKSGGWKLGAAHNFIRKHKHTRKADIIFNLSDPPPNAQLIHGIDEETAGDHQQIAPGKSTDIP